MYSKRHILECKMDEKNEVSIYSSYVEGVFNSIDNDPFNNIVLSENSRGASMTLISSEMAVSNDFFLDDNLNIVSRGQYMVSHGDYAAIRLGLPQLTLLDIPKSNSIKSSIKDKLDINVRLLYIDDKLYLFLDTETVDFTQLREILIESMTKTTEDIYKEENLINALYIIEGTTIINALNVHIYDINDNYLDRFVINTYNPMIDLMEKGLDV